MQQHSTHTHTDTLGAGLRVKCVCALLDVSKSLSELLFTCVSIPPVQSPFVRPEVGLSWKKWNESQGDFQWHSPWTRNAASVPAISGEMAGNHGRHGLDHTGANQMIAFVLYRSLIPEIHHFFSSFFFFIFFFFFCTAACLQIKAVSERSRLMGWYPQRIAVWPVQASRVSEEEKGIYIKTDYKSSYNQLVHIARMLRCVSESLIGV